MSKQQSKKYYTILKNLGVFKYLTLYQMVEIGIVNSINNLYPEISQLVKDGYVYKKSERGKKAMYYLTKKGARITERMFEFPVRFPKSNHEPDKMFQDYQHKIAIVDAHIAISKFDVLRCYTEFDYSGSQRTHDLQEVTRIYYGDEQYIIPDLIFELQTQKRKEFYIVEVETGSRQHIKQKLEKSNKLEIYAELYDTWTVYDQFDLDGSRPYKVLYIFEDPKSLKHTIHLGRLKKFNEWRDKFLFKSFEDDFFDGWTNMEGKKRWLFYE